ncbi:MAG: maleylpyruvate isomerase family mycothiol-dependent enzyme [Gemmatimonadota bacterium]
MTSGTIESLPATRALREAAARTAGLLRTVRQPGAAVPGLTWTAAETAAHMVAEFRDYAAFARGERDAGAPLASAGRETAAQRQAAANAAQLARFPERDLSRLADLVVPAAEDFLAAVRELGTGERIGTSNGLAMTPPTMAAALLGELVVHGHDIARAAGVPWPISRPDAVHVIAGVMAMVPGYLDQRRAAGLHVSYELRLRGGPRYRIAIDDGVAEISPPGLAADCWISADPAAFLLVGYGRTGQWGQIARGKLVAGGRKPWLGFAFGQLITGP